MTRKLVWFEGVDFDDCVFDTNDISTIRGASLALLDAPRLLGDLLWNLPGLNVTEVFAGTSQGLFGVPEAELARVEAEIDAFVAGKRPAVTLGLPLTALRFVRGVADLDEADPVASMRKAQAAARRAQLQGEASRVAEEPGTEACPIERRRPADASIPLPVDRALDMGIAVPADAPPGRETVEVRVSSLVRDRRDWGREQRRTFFAGSEARKGRRAYVGEAAAWWKRWQRHLEDGDTRRGNFVLDLQEMVDAPPDAAFPVSLDNKIAVLYADGNGFGKILATCRTLDEVAAFSKETRALMRGLLDAVLERLAVIAIGAGRDPSGRPLPSEAAAFFDEDAAMRLRFESLLYGGDEICWVFPAWLALDLLHTIFTALDGKTLRGRPATFSCGLVIADRKMPIADLRSLAHDAADLAKIEPVERADGSRCEAEAATRVSIEIFESIEPPSGGLAAHRRRTLGEGKDVKRFLSLDRADFAAVVDWIRDRKSDGAMPRSQIVRILGDAQRGGLLPQDGPRRLGAAGPARADAMTADQRVERAVADYAKRLGREVALLMPGLLTDPFSRPGQAEPPLGRTSAPALDLWLVAQLWDYVDPFAGDLA